MGLIRAGVATLGGSLADQWKDFHTVPAELSQTAALFPAVRRGTNAGRGSNTKASVDIITNGSQIIVPEGYALLTFQDGELTSVATDPGAYIWDSEELDSQSIYAEDGWVRALLGQSWERFKFGGRPRSQQIALFVSLKELPNNKFGTQSAIYWDDAYLNAQVGATTRGTYTLRIVDPILFVRNLVPASYLQNGKVVDFTDPNNEIASQLFSEVVASLAAAFSGYMNNPSRDNRISNIQRDSVGFSNALSRAVDDGFQWTADRGLTITKAAILGVEYDEPTRELLKTVQRADALAGDRGNSNLQASVAAGLESAGAVDGAAGIVGMGIAAGGIGLSGMQQLAAERKVPSTAEGAPPPAADGDDMLERLQRLKDAFDSGLITQDDYDAARAKALGL